MKPILFNTEMVKAILDGRKTVTRRAIKGLGNIWHINKLLGDWALSVDPYIENSKLYWRLQTDVDDSRLFKANIPYQVGDILYVKETWNINYGGYNYFASLPKRMAEQYKWKPSIHMPKEAARIFLSVKDVRVERLQDITEEEAEKEGAKAYGSNNCSGTSARIAFAEIWDGATKSEYEWRNNPWVWVIEFERISKEEAYAERN